MITWRTGHSEAWPWHGHWPPKQTKNIRTNVHNNMLNLNRKIKMARSVKCCQACWIISRDRQKERYIGVSVIYHTIYGITLMHILRLPMSPRMWNFGVLAVKSTRIKDLRTLTRRDRFSDPSTPLSSYFQEAPEVALPISPIRKPVSFIRKPVSLIWKQVSQMGRPADSFFF